MPQCRNLKGRLGSQPMPKSKYSGFRLWDSLFYSNYLTIGIFQNLALCITHGNLKFFPCFWRFISNYLVKPSIDYFVLAISFEICFFFLCDRKVGMSASLQGSITTRCAISMHYSFDFLILLSRHLLMLCSNHLVPTMKLLVSVLFL